MLDKIRSLFKRSEEGSSTIETTETINQPGNSTAKRLSFNNEAFTTGLNTSLDVIINKMLNELEGFLAASLPSPNVSIVSLAPRSVGIGNHRGNERRGKFNVISLKGKRLDTVVRFQLWGATPEAVDLLATELNIRLMTNHNLLTAKGFLKLSQHDASGSEFISSMSAWRKQVDFKILYEFGYFNTDGANSLITRIPVHTDPEIANSPFRETTVVTDKMVRWDNENSPLLLLRGRSAIKSLSALIFVPGDIPDGKVTFLRTFEHAIGSPKDDYPDFAEFIAAVTRPDNPDRHCRFEFASLADFLDEFSPAGDDIELGDWNNDGTKDNFESKLLTFETAIQLREFKDLLEISYETAAFNKQAIMYMQSKTT